ncbi:MAG: flagellar hook-basal body complex protein FliE [Desulfoarculaceae bacterium]|nr:flagellar hook-basal body complex protein FliE [Desulfoarculaceae bacterium]
MYMQISGIGGSLPLRPTDTSAVSTAKNGFGDIMKSTIDQVNQAQNRGDLAIEQLSTGKAESLHEVMIAVEEADISLKMLVQMRNKALQAYEEIMRMQI